MQRRLYWFFSRSSEGVYIVIQWFSPMVLQVFLGGDLFSHFGHHANRPALIETKTRNIRCVHSLSTSESWRICDGLSSFVWSIQVGLSCPTSCIDPQIDRT